MTREGTPHTHRVILRLDEDGKICATNETARRVLGDYCLGKSCHEVVRGTGQNGEAMCGPNCARDLAFGLAVERGVVHARLRDEREAVKIECSRVGKDVHVVIDPAPAFDVTERLTERERRVLALVARGLSSADISTRLGIQVSTVRTHVEHARRRLNATTRAEAVLRAVETHQLNLDEE